ncbi:hypothetical protein A5773_20095 [Mycobacterium sp. 852014-52450_SCH5900713]|nr:hypothetical protein A5773_20095 [Mycobacterium sp. 852014-52450_SCH5900713]
MGVPDPDAVDAVAVLMTEVSEGRLTADTMADRAAARVREVFGQCDGPADPLWPVHVDLCRQVLGHGGLPAAELAQWLSVARSRENPSRPGDYPLAPGETGSGELSAQYGGADAEAEAEAKPVARQADTVDAMDAVDDDDETIEVPDELADQIKALIAQHHREHPRPREDDNQ